MERKGLLDAIAAKLRSLGYVSLIFDFERPTDRDLTETVKILAGLSRFVIALRIRARSLWNCKASNRARLHGSVRDNPAARSARFRDVRRPSTQISLGTPILRVQHGGNPAGCTYNVLDETASVRARPNQLEVRDVGRISP
jgi:hypothetical protein